MMRALWFSLLLVGCNDAPPGDARLHFLGTWTNSAGSVKSSCTGMAAQTSALSAGSLVITISDGAPGAIVLAFADPPNCQAGASGSTPRR